MKFFKNKNLLNVLYAVLISLPLFSILGRVLYTQWNQNSKDSYYGEEINNKTTTLIDSFDGLKLNETYHFISSNAETVNSYAKRIYISNVKNIQGNYPTDFDTLLMQADSFMTTYYSNGYLALYEGDTNIGNLDMNTRTLTFDFELDGVTYPSGYTYLELFDSFIYRVEYNKYSYLDNAFDYSISRFVSENDFGKLNFFTWFSDLFLSNNSVNNLYIHFVNWYLNYTLYVSLGYILWLVLMWFVSFIRRLLEKTSTYETGGF